MDKHNIWLLLDSSKAGGIESHVLQLAQGLQEHGETPLVVFLSDYGKHPLRELLAQSGIAQLTLNGRWRTLFHKLRRASPAILHTHGYKAGIYGRLAAKANKIPVFSTYHAGEIATGRLAFYDRIDRLTAVFADQLFAVSPQIAARLPNRVKVLDNFVSTTHLQHSTGQQIAFVGRVSEEKGPDHFAHLAEHFLDDTFHLYGDGPKLAELKKYAPENLKLHGQQDDMNAVWAQIGLLVIPSRYEGLPMAALEAMARGIPVLAFGVGALDKLIEHNGNGWLIKPEDIEQMAVQLKRWQVMSVTDKQRMQEKAIQTISKQFSSDIAIPKLIARYRKFTQ
ncbi:MAG: glycosyltransferase involved in cell wall biosynthesis [Psychromonas sp.]|jgi:glycosyltransferase involved in cell wall biosynthesis|uniref:glycosyltransferase family 4 protein n=1 Tax=Psychromonas sp. TaxID=1884585 RepID=UPI0039E6D60E